MILKKIIAGSLFILSAFSSFNSFADVDSKNQCNILLSQAQDNYKHSNLALKVISYDQVSVTPYTLIHQSIDDKQSYAVWENLNGEVRGYAIKEQNGFTYNKDRLFRGSLFWHNTLIWNKLFDQEPDISTFSCVLTGRMRVAGYKASLIRLVPQDALRYSYLISIDEENKLPVELVVVDPTGIVVTRITVLLFQKYQDKAPLQNESFLTNQIPLVNKILDRSNIWRELDIPPFYNLVDSGISEDLSTDGFEFQEFTDGITSFKVFKGPALKTLVVPVVKRGSLITYRVNSKKHEYAVVGEVPLRLAQSILSKVNM